MRTLPAYSIVLLTLLATLSYAASSSGPSRNNDHYVISNSGIEVEYTYTTSYRSMFPAGSMSADDLAHFHAEHVFGLFHSPEYAEQYGVPADLDEGFAGSKHPEVSNVSAVEQADGSVLVTYTAHASMVLLKEVFAGWSKNWRSKKSGTVELPLLDDMTKIYKLNTPDADDYDESEGDYIYADEKLRLCTDEHYNTAVDFSYFYNPYRVGCSRLRKAPLAKNVQFNIKVVDTAGQKQKTFPTNALKAANGNGRLVMIYFALGFDHTPEIDHRAYRQMTKEQREAYMKKVRRKNRKDEAWELFASMEDKLAPRGFTKMNSLKEFRDTLGKSFEDITLETNVKLNYELQGRFFNTFVKEEDGKIYVVRIGLFDSVNSPTDSKVTFTKFWKEAWENGDFIYFGGHSGDGVSLDTENMLDKLENAGTNGIQFNARKTQVAFFDACSSYAHYKDMYSSKKNKNLSIISYGLVSLFHTADITMSTLLDFMLNKDLVEPEWTRVLGTIEKNQLEPHIYSTYDDPEATQIYNKYVKKGLTPKFLLNVQTD